MSRTNDESHIRLQPDERIRRELEIPMASFQEKLEALHLKNGRENTSQEGEIEDLTNIMLFELLQKQNEQIQYQSEHLQ